MTFVCTTAHLILVMDIVDGYGSRGGSGVKHHASKSRVEGRNVVDCDIWWPVIGNYNDSQKPLKGFLFAGVCGRIWTRHGVLFCLIGGRNRANIAAIQREWRAVRSDDPR